MSTDVRQRSPGARLLNRLRLSSEQQRLALVGTGQSLHFDAVKEAAQLQFPDHRPVPPVTYAREFDRDPRSQDQRSSGDRDGKDGRQDKGKGKGKPKGGQQQRAHKRTLRRRRTTTRTATMASHWTTSRKAKSTPPRARPRMMTIPSWSRRLQGVRLTGPKQSVEDRKKQSCCAACGEKGHWRGDPICSVLGKSSGKRRRSRQGKREGIRKGPGQEVREQQGHDRARPRRRPARSLKLQYSLFKVYLKPVGPLFFRGVP